MAQLEVTQADVVVGLVDLSTDGEMLDHIPHHAKAFSKIASLVKTHTDLECRLGSLILVAVVLGSGRLEMNPCLVVSPITFQEEIAQADVSLVTNPAPGVPLDHALPHLHGLLELPGFQPRVTGFNEFFGGTVLDQRPPHSLFLFSRGRGLGGVLRGGLADNDRQ